MANHSSNTRVSGELAARLGRLLIALFAGKDLRVREVIARGVARGRASRSLHLKTRWHAGHDLATDPRAE